MMMGTKHHDDHGPCTTCPCQINVPRGCQSLAEIVLAEIVLQDQQQLVKSVWLSCYI
jgi:hypothetical protein